MNLVKIFGFEPDEVNSLIYFPNAFYVRIVAKDGSSLGTEICSPEVWNDVFPNVARQFPHVEIIARTGEGGVPDRQYINVKPKPRTSVWNLLRKIEDLK